MANIRRLFQWGFVPVGFMIVLRKEKNLDSGALVEAADEKSTEVLAPFWKRLKYSRAKVEAVATDSG